MDPLLLPWQHFLGRALRKDRVLGNSYDVTVTSFLNQSQQNFLILLEILSCTFVPNLSKIRLFMFPWQHILETALMRNGAIQLSNDVTVTLFLNQSLQTFEMFLEMVPLYKRTCEANAAGENSSLIFTVCIKSVPHCHFKLP